jgi:hypothetical protein
LDKDFDGYKMFMDNLAHYTRKNLKYVFSLQNQTDFGYGTVYTTALAIHADLSRLAGTTKKVNFNFNGARKWMVDAQREVKFRTL